MFRKVLKTYDRKNNRKHDLSTIQAEFNLKPVEIKKTQGNELFNDTLEDPFDTTFDRLMKEYKKLPTKKSTVNSDKNLESSNDSFLKSSSTDSNDSEDESEFRVPKRKSRLKTQNAISEKYENKKPKSSKLVKVKVGKDIKGKKEVLKNENKNQLKKMTVKVNNKRTGEKVKSPAKKKRRLNSDAHDNLTDFVPEKNLSYLENNVKYDSCISGSSTCKVDSNALLSETLESNFETRSKISHLLLKACSISLEPCDWMLKKKEFVLKLKPCSVQIPRLKMNSSNEIVEDSRIQTTKNIKKKEENKHIKECEKNLETSGEDKEGNSLRKSNISLKEGQDKFKKSTAAAGEKEVDKFRKSNNSIEENQDKFGRSNISVEESQDKFRKNNTTLEESQNKLKESNFAVEENQEKTRGSNIVEKKQDETKESNTALEGKQVNFEKSIIKENNSREIKSPMFLKNCSINLTHIKSPKNILPKRLVSSTPFVKKKESFLLPEFSPGNLEISNITAFQELSRIPPTPVEFRTALSQRNEPLVQLEDIRNFKANNNSKMNSINNVDEADPDTWNNSSDYSSLDWVTLSCSESQLAKEPSLQARFRSQSFKDEMMTCNSKEINSPKENSLASHDLSKTKEMSLSKSLKASAKSHITTKRILNRNPEFDVSASLFDDTKLTDNTFTSDLKIPNLSVDKKDLLRSPLLLIEKLSPLEKAPSIKNSSILDQSEFMGFGDKKNKMLYSSKLSPMTSIPRSIVHSITLEDSILKESHDSKKSKLFRTLSFENPDLVDHRKCLNFDEEPKIFPDNEESDVISSKENYNRKESKIQEEEPMELEISSVSSPLKAEESSKYKEVLMDVDNQQPLDDNIQNSLVDESLDCVILKNSQNSLEDNCTLSDDSQETVKLEDFISMDDEVKQIDEEEKIVETMAVKSSEITHRGSLNQLKDPVRINSRKKIYKNWGLQLSAISEKENSRLTEIENETSPVVVNRISIQNKVEASPVVVINKYSAQNKDKASPVVIINKDSVLNKDTASPVVVINKDSVLNKDKASPVVVINIYSAQKDVSSVCETSPFTKNSSLNNDEEEKASEHLFLKPGKSWARSLSILNNIHSKDDVDKFSAGKGQKWRHSVINILDMQNKGLLQSCTKQQRISHSLTPCDITRNGNQFETTRFSAYGSVSPNRFVKRISIRVVPDVKKLDTIEDTQFLEAYGIPSSQSSKAASEKVLSLDENRKFEASSQKTASFNTYIEDSDIKTVDSQLFVTAKNVVLERCRQVDYLPFKQCYPQKFLKDCRKIGEGVYGEVFLHESESDSSVIKIIPIEGDAVVNGEPQKKFHEILSEIVIAKELHDLRFNEIYNTSGFVEVKNIKCIMGKYPQKLIDLWQVFDDEKKSENDCPSMFKDNQLYISLELGNGGKDLEAFVFQNSNESYTVFMQTALALAVAEKSLEFEHRDLHWGNILISRTKKSKVSYKIGNAEINLDSNGLKVAIIDFTLSRMSYKGCFIFNDLALDPALFTAEGEYQFEIYRLMRDKLGNDWQTFEPYTNILWLHYILDKMIRAVRYNNKKKSTKIHKNGIERLKEMKKEILSYDSVYDLVTKCDKFTALYESLDLSTDYDATKSL